MSHRPPREVADLAGVPGQVTPQSLLVRARARDPEAWCRLVELYRPLVIAWCGRAGVSDFDAEDVAQDVFTGMSAGLERFRRNREGDTFRGWLRVITRNQILHFFRKSNRQGRAEGGSDAWQRLQEIPDPLADTGEDESAEVGELYLRALELVRGDFEERTWRAFWMSVVEGREPALLAEELGMTANNVRQAKSRVLRRLRQEVGDLLD